MSWLQTSECRILLTTTTRDCSAGVLRQWTSYNTNTSRQTDRQTDRQLVTLSC